MPPPQAGSDQLSEEAKFYIALVASVKRQFQANPEDVSCFHRAEEYLVRFPLLPLLLRARLFIILSQWPDRPYEGLEYAKAAVETLDVDLRRDFPDAPIYPQGTLETAKRCVTRAEKVIAAYLEYPSSDEPQGLNEPADERYDSDDSNSEAEARTGETGEVSPSFPGGPNKGDIQPSQVDQRQPPITPIEPTSLVATIATDSRGTSRLPLRPIRSGAWNASLSFEDPSTAG